MTAASNGTVAHQSERIVSQPDSYDALARGFGQIVEAIRPSLGPLPRHTAIEQITRTKPPEILDSGGTIARRIVGIADRDADMGAMLLRHALWKLHEDVGDGTVRAAVIFQTLFEEGRRYVEAGGNVVGLTTGLKRGMRLVDETLMAMATPLEGKEAIASVAEAICQDDALAALLGEVINIIGEYGALEIRDWNRIGVEREYIEGAYWESGCLSPPANTDQIGREVHLHEPAILISNLVIDDVSALAHVLELVARKGGQSLVVMARSLSEQALALLHRNQKQNGLLSVAVKTPSGMPEQMWGMQDISVLTGGRLFLQEAGMGLSKVRWDDLGKARRAWATKDHFGCVGGQGDLKQLREHLVALKKSMVHQEDTTLRRLTQARIGRLLGGSAILWVGGATESEITFRKKSAERTARVLRRAIRDGVVPGGGIALLGCRHALSASTESEEEKVAFRILKRALEAPARTILENAGYEPYHLLSNRRAAAQGYGFDVTTDQVVDMREAGILDPAAVLRALVRVAVTTATLALSIGVLVHSANPEIKLET